jgi:hypothetical protein
MSADSAPSEGMTVPATPQRGDFVRVRTRRWLVEDERSAGDGLTALRLACVDDDAQGEVVEVLWDAELDGSVNRQKMLGTGNWMAEANRTPGGMLRCDNEEIVWAIRPPRGTMDEVSSHVCLDLPSV